MDSRWHRGANRRFNKYRNDHDRQGRRENFPSDGATGSSAQGHEHPKRHPAHLRGKAIGMFYAQRSKNSSKKRFQEPDQVNLNENNENKISDLLHKIKSNHVEGYSEEGAGRFQNEYSRHLQGNLAADQCSHLSATGLESDPALDQSLYEEMEKRNTNSQYLEMQKFRKTLPALKQEKDIVAAVDSSQVIVISGETGCGKSTQVSQFILDSFIAQGKGSQCHIVCTQPRRISAISVAERVAEERAEVCGGNKGSVGWQIRLESRIPRNKGSILYCTTGIVLQWLQSNNYLTGVSHIILDEIHERSLDSDFLMIILKDVLQARPDLKLILMSATLNAQMFSKYFFDCPMVHIPGYTFPVREFFLEDILEKTGYSPQAQSNSYKRKPLQGKEKEYQENIGPFLRSIQDRYSRRTMDTLYNWCEDRIDFGLIVSLLRHICLKEKEGAILVFLPGWADISTLNNMLMEDAMFRTSRFRVIPLHSMMPTVNQREIFNPAPKGVRKIVIATSIAETSITINDVVFVVDSGFMKLGNFDVEANVSTLRPEWVAMANAKQRRGRAGRVQPGICFKLYTRLREQSFDEYCQPEMLRTRLESLCLKLKILNLGYIEPFLSKAMDPPVSESVRLSVEMLKKLNALDCEEQLTPLGFHLARLPLDPQTGRMILFGAIFSCLDPILTVAASLSFKDAFFTPLGKEQIVDERKKVIAQNSQSDHLMLAYALDQWEKACRFGNDRDYCWQNFLSASTLTMLANLKKQFSQYLCDLHFLHSPDHKHKDFNRNSGNQKLLKAVICAGLYPNIAKLKSKRHSGGNRRPPTLITGDGKVTFHPKSVLNGTQDFSSLWTVYYQKVKSSKVYLHDVTVVHPYAVLLFGGQLTKGLEGENVTLSMEKWITFCCQQRVAELIPALRKELDDLLEHKVNSPGVTDWNPNCKEGAVLQSIVDLLSSEDELNSLPSRFHQELEDDDYPEDCNDDV